MAKYNFPTPKTDEFTELMHSEFTIDAETELKHTVWCIIGIVKSKIFTLDEALEIYQVSQEEYDKYKDTYPE